MKFKKKISVSELKVHALQIIEDVKTKNEEIEIFKRGKRVAKIIPFGEKSVQEAMNDWLGCLDGSVKKPRNPDLILEPLDSKWDANE